MPRLTAFATCNDVLYDQEQHPSLIHVFSAVTVNGPLPDLQPNAVLQKAWRIFTMWQADEGDVGVEFVQRCILTAPNGNEVGHAELRFTMSKPSHNLFLAVPFLPIGVAGRVAIRIYLERNEEKVTSELESSVLIIHVPLVPETSDVVQAEGV